MDAVRQAVPPTYRSEWSLFVDWCTAMDASALPAHPVTVAEFLAYENPGASRAVLRRRVAAINHAHRGAGHLEPGTVTAVRRLLSVRRRDPAAALECIRQLPTTGWPSGLFGRRDALVLWLAEVVGVRAADVGQLRCADITSDGQVVQIGAGHNIDIAVDPDDPYGLLPVWRRWAQLRDRLAVRPGPAVLVKPLTEATPISAGSRPSTAVPPPPARSGFALLPPFDRWGNVASPIGRDEIGMTGQAVAEVISTHLYGPGRGDLSRTGWVDRILERTRSTPAVDPNVADPADAGVAAAALPDRYGAAVQAKRSAADELAGLDETYSDIDRRTAELLARTEQLLAEFAD